ncbi:zinc protease PQQL-like isoform X3 [Gastrolobium bilobum]|uniref:zinc protease PQQL-like isoform X3 n=1 Tax=Gastrolobium bilobum TaxID=150636 RepID=UPI002AAFCDD2|nr:zinc protease PQQL-like isoform X3 [Gastrolobium bilobum]
MELLPGGGGGAPIPKKQGFRSLKPVNADMEQVLAEQPVGVDYGTLDNGLRYYVRCNSKPRMRAALALAVRVGSVLEEEDERGVAHIVEHLAFSATKRYTNHDIVKFLESIGAEFGACQNAVTSSDDTVYELLVPVDKPELLSQAISVLAEFSSEIRVSKDDLEKERGAVMEEYRASRNATGRLQEAHWILMMEGSKYAERLPIGLERVIRTVAPETVKHFYEKWYHLCNMAVIAVGDFSDTQGVVELIKTHFGQKIPAPNPPLIPTFQVPSHDEPRFSCFVESEAAGSAVMISYKMPADELKTVKDYRNLLAESMFLYALNQRFFKISRRKDPPCFSCSAAADVLVRPLKANIITSSCKGKGTIEALESMLIEVARVRLHGFSEREISVVRALLMSDIESSYLERDQIQSTSLRDEYLQHFLHDEPVIGIEYEAQLQKTLLPHISALEVSKCSEKLRTSCSCVIKTIEPQPSAVVDDLTNVVKKVNLLEEEGRISSWDDEHIPEEIVITKPNMGHVVKELEYSNVGATELILSNGMRICYKRTDFLDDQLVYQLFTTNLTPDEEDVKIVMQMAEEAVCAQDRDPYTAFANRVKELNYGNSYFFRPIRKSDLQKVDPLKACEYFSKCFKDPSTFTVVIVGNIDPTIALPLILQYLGGIPKPPEPIMNFNRDELKGLPFTFPTTIYREVVRSPMVEAQCLVQLCFPVELKNGTMVEEIHLVGFLSKLLETKIMQVLRFKHGQIYSVGVSVFLGGNKPSRIGDVCGDISINFSCDPEISSKLVDFALDEMLRLQDEGPSEQDVSTILEIEQRAHENGLQENYYWLDKILHSYQSRVYSGDVGTSFVIQDEGRLKVRSSLTPSTARLALQKILPFPCKNQYTVVILMPKSSPFKLLKSVFQSTRTNYGRKTKILVGIAGLAVLAFSLLRHSRSAQNNSKH